MEVTTRLPSLFAKASVHVHSERERLRAEVREAKTLRAAKREQGCKLSAEEKRSRAAPDAPVLIIEGEPAHSLTQARLEVRDTAAPRLTCATAPQAIFRAAAP